MIIKKLTSTFFEGENAGTALKTIRIFAKEMAREKNTVIKYTLLISVNRLINYVLLPLIFSFIIQSLILNPLNWGYPIVLLVIALVAVCVSAVSAAKGLKDQFSHEERLSTRLLEISMRALMRHSDQFFANKKVGSIAGDVTSFSRSIVALLDTIYLNLSSIIINVIASLIIIAIMAPVLLIPLTVASVFLIMHSIGSIKKRRPFRNTRKRLASQLTGTIADILGNYQIVRFFAGEKREIRQVLNDRLDIEKVAAKEIDIILHESYIRQMVLFSLQIMTMAICIVLFINGALVIAALIFAVTYLGRLTGSLFEITAIIRNIEQAFIDAADMTDILDEPIEVTNVSRASELKIKKGTIDFESVNFAYKDSQNEVVIHDFSLSIQSGESIGLAGHSGGGKTTLSKLLLRFADIQGGVIRIDGQDISTVTQESLHTAIAYVPQEAYLFHRSLRDNVAYGRPDATEAEIVRAIEQANASEFINKLPNGLDTIVGERGVKLSGGQRQRIAIARAILKDAPILVLDEATSALDSHSEMLIQDSLAKLMKGRTSLVVAHRLSTIARLDRIVVIDNGQIKENGTHTELLELDGLYAKLWAHQSGGFIQD